MRLFCRVLFLPLFFASLVHAELTPLEKLLETAAIDPDVAALIRGDQQVKAALLAAESRQQTRNDLVQRIRKSDELTEQVRAAITDLEGASGQNVNLGPMIDELNAAIDDFIFFHGTREMPEQSVEGQTAADRKPGLAEWRDFYQSQLVAKSHEIDSLIAQGANYQQLQSETRHITLRLGMISRMPAQRYGVPKASAQGKALYDAWVAKTYFLRDIVDGSGHPQRQRLEFDAKTKKPSNPELYKKLADYHAKLQNLAVQLGAENAEKEIYLGDDEIYKGREISLELTTASNLVGAMRALEATHADTRLARLMELKESLRQKERELNDLKALLDSEKRHLNLNGYQTLSRAMSALTREIDAKVKSGQKEDKSLRIAFMALMNALENFEFNLATGEYRNSSPYPTFGRTHVLKMLQAKIGGADLDQPSKMDLMLNYHWARHGKLGAKSVASAYYQTFKTLVTNVLNPLKSGANVYEWLKGDFIDTLKRGEFAGAFAHKYPLIASDIAGNLHETYEVLQMDRSSPVKELWSNIKAIVEVTETRNKVVDLLLGEETFVYSSQDIDEAPIDVNMLAIVDMASWAPYIAASYIGGRGQTQLSSLAQWGVKGAGAVVVPALLFATGGAGVIAVTLGATTGFVTGWAGQTLAGSTIGVLEVYSRKSISAMISRQNAVLAGSLLRGIQEYSNSRDPMKAIYAVAKYQIARKVMIKFGTLARSLRRGSFFKDYLSNFGQCVKENKGATAGGLAAGSVGGLILGAFATTTAITAAPLLVAVGVAASVCVGVVKFVDWALGKDVIRKEQQQAKELQDIGEKIRAENVKEQDAANQILDLDRLAQQEKEAGLKEAISKITKADYEEMAKDVQLAKLVAAKDYDAAAQRQWELFESKVNAKLAELEARQPELIAEGVRPVADPQFDAALEGLKQSEASKRQSSAGEVRKLVIQWPKDQFQDRILAEIMEIEKTGGDAEKTPALVERIRKDLTMSRIVQISKTAAQRIDDMESAQAAAAR